MLLLQLENMFLKYRLLRSRHSADSVIESTIKVYELLGAEVFLYFDIEGTQMTARVNPRTTLRTGDHAVFALDMEKIHLFDKDTELTITN